MEILEFGNKEKPKIILIHGFQVPYQIWEDYIDYYKGDFHIIVPILAGHNPEETEDFISFDKCAKELEDFYINRFGEHVYAIYGMSMGGVLASFIWKNKNIKIEKLILESSPLLPFGNLMTKIIIKKYLTITHKAQIRDKKTLSNAVKLIITEDKLDVFLELLDNMSDMTIINYIEEVGKFKLPKNIDTPNTEIFYYYGGKISEILFRKVAKYIKSNYSNSKTICLKGKGHCEGASKTPEKLDNILKS